MTGLKAEKEDDHVLKLRQEMSEALAEIYINSDSERLLSFNPNTLDMKVAGYNKTLLMLSVFDDSPTTCAWLLKRGADPLKRVQFEQEVIENKKTVKVMRISNTALYYACALEKIPIFFQLLHNLANTSNDYLASDVNWRETLKEELNVCKHPQLNSWLNNFIEDHVQTREQLESMNQFDGISLGMVNPFNFLKSDRPLLDRRKERSEKLRTFSEDDPSFKITLNPLTRRYNQRKQPLFNKKEIGLFVALGVSIFWLFYCY